MLKVTKIERVDETPFYRLDEFNDKDNAHALSRYVGEVWDDRVNFEDVKWWSVEELKLVIKYMEESFSAPIKKSDQYLTYGGNIIV